MPNLSQYTCLNKFELVQNLSDPDLFFIIPNIMPSITNILGKIQNDSLLSIREIRFINNLKITESEIFHNFEPSQSSSMGEKILSGQKYGTWMLRPSSVLDSFVVHYKREKLYKHLFQQNGKIISSGKLVIGSVLDFFIYLKDIKFDLTLICQKKKCAVFDFDLTLTTVHQYSIKMAVEFSGKWYTHPNEELNNLLLNLKETKKSLNDLTKEQTIDIFFGGNFRYEKLVSLFRHLKTNNVDIFISSRNYYTWLKEILTKVDLFEMFDEIYGNDYPKVYIIETKINTYNSVTYIDDVHDEHNQLIKKLNFTKTNNVNSFIAKYTNPFYNSYYFSDLFTSKDGLTISQLDELRESLDTYKQKYQSKKTEYLVTIGK